MGGLEVVDGALFLNGSSVNAEEARAWLDGDPEAQAYKERETAQREVFDLLFAATDAIRDYNENLSAWAFGPRDEDGVPLYGSAPDVETYVVLQQQAGTAFLRYNALDASLVTPELDRQWKALTARSAEAVSLMGLAA